MACPDLETLAASAERLLGPQEREEVLDHAAECDDCRRILLTLEADQPAAVARPRSTVRIRPHGPSAVPWAVAAALAIAIVGLVLYAGRVSAPTTSPEARRNLELPVVEPPVLPTPEPVPSVKPAPIPEAPRPEVPPVAPKEPAPPKEPKPAPTPEAPAPNPETPAPTAPKPATVAVAAVLDGFEGDVFVLSGRSRIRAAVGQNLLAGDGVECEGARSGALVAFADKTRLELAADTRVREMTERDAAKGRRIVVEKGSVKAEVAKQPAGLPMMFETPHGEAKVLGTTLALHVDADPKKGTRLEVEEGKVELKNSAGRTVLVEPGHQAVAAAGVAMAVKALPKEEVLFSFTFEDGKKPSTVSGTIERGPGGRICLAGEPDPGGTSRVFIGDTDRGLFTYQGDEVLSFDYWVDGLAGSVNFNLWNRTQKRTHDGIVSKLAVGKWTRVTFRLADLGEPDTRPKDGDWIVNLHLQGTGTPPRKFYLDNIVLTRTRTLKPRVFEAKK